jgi:hypothetical protein
MARLRFTNRFRVCDNVTLSVEFFSSNGEQCLTVHLGLRPAKPYENVSAFRTMEPRSGEIEQTVEKSRLFNCLIRSVRIERMSGRCLS